MRVDEGIQSAAFLGQSLHSLNVCAAGTVLCVKVEGTVFEAYVNGSRLDFVRVYSGIPTEILVRLHGYIPL